MKARKNQITVFEHEAIRVGETYGKTKFTEKHRLALEQHYGKGKDYIRLIHKGVQFNEFVGVLQIGNLLIEVLPKADRYSEQEDWRKLLIGMLRAVGAFDVKAPTSSSLTVKPDSILDLYFHLFLNEVEYLMRAGLIKKYRKKEENSFALKGALQFGKHLSKNVVHQERFFVRHTVYDHDHLINQILHKTLKLLYRLNVGPVLTSRVGSLLLWFPDLGDLKVTDSTFNKIVLNRKTVSYRTALDISRLLLLNYHPDVSKGGYNVLAIMFDMNQLWETFIYKSLRLESDGKRSVSPQASRSFWQPKAGRKSTIRPDVVISADDETIVLDTKWKNLEKGNPSSEDLRQLYVYHEYFNADKVALVYPGAAKSSYGTYHEKGSEVLSSKTCSVIRIPTILTIKEWQTQIRTSVFENWPTE